MVVPADGRVRVLDAGTGAERWGGRPVAGGAQWVASRDGRLVFAVSPAADGASTLVTAVDPGDGRVRWRERLEGALSPVETTADGGGLVLLSADAEQFVDAVVRLGTEDGTVRRVPLATPADQAQAAVDGDTVYVVGSGGSLAAVDVGADGAGRERWRLETGAARVSRPVVARSGGHSFVLLSASDGRLLAVDGAQAVMAGQSPPRRAAGDVRTCRPCPPRWWRAAGRSRRRPTGRCSRWTRATRAVVRHPRPPHAQRPGTGGTVPGRSCVARGGPRRQGIARGGPAGPGGGPAGGIAGGSPGGGPAGEASRKRSRRGPAGGIAGAPQGIARRRSAQHRDVPDRALVGAGGHRRVGPQGPPTPLRSRFFGAYVPPRASRRAASVASSTRSSMERFGMSMRMRSPSSTSAMVPPDAASGEAWPIDRPDVPPEKRPSVISAQVLPRPRLEEGRRIEHLLHAGAAARAPRSG